MSIRLHFMDSGAFTLRTKALEQQKKQGGNLWAYYKTDEFWKYMQKYVRFIKKYNIAIDYYTNIDAIRNGTLSWRNQKWLEKKGVHPIPVVHYPKDVANELSVDVGIEWLQRYVESGYTYIGIGGLATRDGEASSVMTWLDKCFRYLKNHSNVRIHGFGITHYNFFTRYPWYSVDSTTWIKRGAFGEILIPQYGKNGYRFDKHPRILPCSLKHRVLSRTVSKKGFLPTPNIDDRIFSLTKHGWKKWHKQTRDWFQEIGINAKKLPTDNDERTRANVRFFQYMSKACGVLLFYSGGPAENFTEEDVDVMTTFYDHRNEVNLEINKCKLKKGRFLNLFRERRNK